MVRLQVQHHDAYSNTGGQDLLLQQVVLATGLSQHCGAALRPLPCLSNTAAFRSTGPARCASGQRADSQKIYTVHKHLRHHEVSNGPPEKGPISRFFSRTINGCLTLVDEGPLIHTAYIRRPKNFLCSTSSVSLALHIAAAMAPRTRGN